MINSSPYSSDSSYPLSSSQSRIWFMEKLDHEIRAYNIPVDLRITGDLDLAVLQRSIDLLVERHAALRTVFPNGNGQPSQKVLPPHHVPISMVHLEDEPAGTKEEKVAMHSLQNAMLKFDLDKGPLYYFELLFLGKGEYRLLVNFHHIISDATSVGIFLDEFQSVYTALAENKPVSLPQVRSGYTEYAVREKERADSQEMRKQLEFWKKELEGAPEMLLLPTDHRRPKMQSYNGTEFHFKIHETLRARIAALGKRHRTGMFVPLLTAFYVLLSRYSSQQDLVVGVPVANRRNEDLDHLFGVLINTLPVRLVLPDPLSFAGAVDLVRDKFSTAYENQEVPFERLVEELKVKRNLGVSPICQVLFNYLTDYLKELQMPGVTFRMIHGERRTSQGDLTLMMSDQKNELDCMFEYNTDLFRGETIKRLAGHYITILEAVASDETVDIRSIPILTAEEKKLNLGIWNDTTVPYPSDKCTHHVFEEQVLRTPNAIALEDDHEQLTYSALNERANRLARILVKNGASEDTFVGVFLDRTTDLTVSLLAVAKTGATSIPLDPIFPKARIGLILENSNPVILITKKSLLDELPVTSAQKVLVDDRTVYEKESGANLSLGNPQKAAFVLYTSGSTGKPKGVLVKHHSMVNSVRAITKQLEVTADDVVLACATITFDVAEMEIYLPLLNGAKMVLASQDTASNIDLLMKKLADSKATVFMATPVTFKMLVMSSWPGKPDLRILIGGETLTKELAREMVQRCKKVFNGYAPTETTVYSVIRPVTPEDLEGDGSIPIGKPLDNTVLYVLNPKRVPVPVGVPGELYIGGVGVAAGYLNLPQMTAERFIEDPVGLNPGMMFYKTGDLVQYNSTGDLIFLNRMDFQVKIRGFRIELEEIEAVISQFQGIKANVVVVRKDPSGEKMLAAYLIPEEGSKPDLHALAEYLKGRLPDYMVPAAFVTMDQFPLTSTLKVDRNALPEPELGVTAASTEFVEPSTPTQKKIAAIWRSLLSARKIGIHDDFFEIGGQSMIAVALVVKIEKELGTRIPLATLFERSTIFDLAELVDGKSGTVEWRSLVPIRPAGNRKPLFLVHGMGLNVLLYTTVVNYLDADQPVYGLQAKGLDGVEQPLDTIEEIAAYYISEILTVDPEGPYAMAGFSLGGRIAYEMARQLVAMGKEVSFTGIIDATADETYAHLPLFERNMKKLDQLAKYVSWNIRAFFREDSESTWSLIRRRWKGLEKKLKGLDFNINNMNKEDLVSHGKLSELPKYLRRVHRANSRADRTYTIPSYSGTVHLFKAKKQTFYIPEPVKYGWDRVALGGVIVHEVPGEHSNTFAPPNDKFFADLLQKSLNESRNTNH